MQALKNSKGYDPIDKIFAYVRDQVSKTMSDKLHTQQSPVMSRSEHGAEIILGAPVRPEAATVGFAR